MIGLDTNVLVRYLAQDDEGQSARATRLIEGELSASNPGWISLVVLLETVWVMGSCYRTPLDQISLILLDLLDTAALQVQEAPAVRTAVERCHAGGVDLHDALIVSLARQRSARVVTFDVKAAQRLGMELLA